ncbi:unnamed protein product [Linum trigynum]|uniref:Uncharacterized protein n=1 Tax=Linum trigynum TaxID=586398 RepID=A0AAV2DW57_9ROSI
MTSELKARGKESPKAPEPAKPSKAPKLMSSESPTESTTKMGTCVRCLAVGELKLVPKNDDSNYVVKSDDFKGDEELKLRVIHYRRKKWISGCFYADCPPNYPSFEGIYYYEHLPVTPDTKQKLDKSLQFAIDKYNKEKGDNLTLDGILHTNLETYGSMIFYITFKGFTEKFGVQTYQTVVTCSKYYTGGHVVKLFRNGKGDYEDLLTPIDSSFQEYTRVKKELIYTLDGHVLPSDPFYEDFKRICAEQRERENARVKELM